MGILKRPALSVFRTAAELRQLWSRVMTAPGTGAPLLSTISPANITPWLITIVTGVVVAFFGAVLPVRDAGNLCNIGTLLAFVIVSVGVLVLRVREPELQRKFKVPAIWFVAPMGALSAFALMLYLPLMTWVRLLVWFLIGMVIYFSYGRRHSKLEQPTAKTRPD